MLELIKTEFERLKCKPFPPHGKSIGEFPLYDTLLMGIVSSYLGGEKVMLKVFPLPTQRPFRKLNASARNRRSTSNRNNSWTTLIALSPYVRVCIAHWRPANQNMYMPSGPNVTLVDFC